MVRIITDSSCDLSLNRCTEINVDALPLTVHFGEEHFLANVELTNKEFYERLGKASSLPTTSQITPTTFEEIFRKYIDAGDEIVGLFISSKLSGTFQAANIAKNAIGSEKIHLVETLTTTFPLALLVEEAVKMRDNNFTAKEIADSIERIVPRVRIWAVIDDLKYLKMGGRLSATSAFVANILSICPIITIENGLVEVVGKARGKKAAIAKIEELIKKNPISSDYSVALGHSNEPNALDNLKSAFRPTLKKLDTFECEVGCIVGTHAGPGAYGIAYILR